MTHFFDRIFTRYPVKTRRALELLPGVISWTLIFFPIWGSLFFPLALAYFILFFDVYWFYKSFSLAITAFIASRRIRRAEAQDWVKEVKTLKEFKKITHVIVIPNYKESIEKLRQSIASIANQTITTKKLFVVLGMEEREQDVQQKANTLIQEFGYKFGGMIATFHTDMPGEVKGKSSNQAFAAKKAYIVWVEKGVINEDFATISSVDADSIFDRQYFAYLTHKFLSNKNKYNTFWQSANVNYNNFWKVPAPIRVLSFFGSLWRTGLLVQKDRLVANSTYSLSLRLLRQIDFWDTDVIPEDYRIFFKAFYILKGNAYVEPIFLKTSMDAPLSSTYLKTLKNKYDQERRWSWGVSDDPVFIKWWLTVPGVPFVQKTMMLFYVLLDHFLWPVNWFIITVAANIMPFINPAFSRTTLGYNLPRLAGIILTFCLFATLIMIIIDYRQRPKDTRVSTAKQFLFPLEFVLLPIVGFFLSTLPAIISHTQLMFGKRLEYKVTEKL
ncbi:MAG: glycosyltransferase family 2 protein [Candidatus Levyibacteriota bacterium]|nr:MAG: glycosyltransferase family 2 protein [Candidatus Levybacteria bacterium]